MMQTKTGLAEMALEAAMGIEDAQNRGAQSMSKLHEFMETLSKQISDGGLRDETMFPFYSFALKRSGEEHPTRVEFPQLIARMLEKQKNASPQDGDDLQTIKQFCLAFHEAMIRSVHSNRPRRPQFDGRVR